MAPESFRMQRTSNVENVYMSWRHDPVWGMAYAPPAMKESVVIYIFFNTVQCFQVLLKDGKSVICFRGDKINMKYHDWKLWDRFPLFNTNISPLCIYKINNIS